jgi:hypothetical protein
VTVWEKCGDWFRGEASGRYGLFPGNYVQKAEDTGGDLTYIDMFFNEYEMQVARNTSKSSYKNCFNLFATACVLFT